VAEVFGIDIHCKLKAQKEGEAQERVLFDYLSAVFPIDFYIYHEALKYREYLPSNKNEMKKYQRRSTKEIYVKRRLSRMKKYKGVVRERKIAKAAFNVERCRGLSVDELKFLDACKEAKLFKQSQVRVLPRFIEDVSRVEISPVLKTKPSVRLVNYLLTMTLKLAK
jgi:hypothetical protein